MSRCHTSESCNLLQMSHRWLLNWARSARIIMTGLRYSIKTKPSMLKKSPVRLKHDLICSSNKELRIATQRMCSARWRQAKLRNSSAEILKLRRWIARQWASPSLHFLSSKANVHIQIISATTGRARPSSLTTNEPSNLYNYMNFYQI